MSEMFDITEIRGIRAALLGYEARCHQALAMARGEEGQAADTTKAQDMYRTLKLELKGEVAALKKRPISRAEQCFYEPAIRRAAQEMRSPTDASPLSPKWSTSLVNTSSEFTYYLDRLERSQAE